MFKLFQRAVIVLALLVPALVVTTQELASSGSRGSSLFPRHHGAFSCSLQGATADGSPFDIIISYQENRRGEITSASIFRWKVARYLNARWSWHAYGVNIETRQWGKRYSRRCYASARY